MTAVVSEALTASGPSRMYCQHLVAPLPYHWKFAEESVPPVIVVAGRLDQRELFSTIVPRLTFTAATRLDSSGKPSATNASRRRAAPGWSDTLVELESEMVPTRFRSPVPTFRR